MTNDVNRQWRLRSRPTDKVDASHFEFVKEAIPELDEGEILVRNLWIGMDPAARGWLNDVGSYAPPVQIGDVMRAESVAEVIASRDPNIAVGTLVLGLFGWQDYAVTPGSSDDPWQQYQLVPDDVPPQRVLGALGSPGLTAYVGMLEIGELKEGMNVLVSGAAGAVGSIAAQIARLKGAGKVVGIAGGERKCRWLVEEAKLDAAIDYKAGNLEERLQEEFPEGIDLFFDNVSGPILDAALGAMALFGQVVLCGSISAYDKAQIPPGPANLRWAPPKRLTLRGFIFFDHLERMMEGQQALMRWAAAGELVMAEDVQQGLENAPATLMRLFEGRNLGKQVLKVC